MKRCLLLLKPGAAMIRSSNGDWTHCRDRRGCARAATALNTAGSGSPAKIFMIPTCKPFPLWYFLAVRLGLWMVIDGDRW
jgi:hypothetical protein